jgi:hypothetical protein
MRIFKMLFPALFYSPAIYANVQSVTSRVQDPLPFVPVTNLLHEKVKRDAGVTDVREKVVGAGRDRKKRKKQVWGDAVKVGCFGGV